MTVTAPARTGYDLDNARGLTLQAPWLHAILGDRILAGLREPKRVENRGWPTSPGVDTILLHAGLGWDNAAPAALRLLGIQAPERDRWQQLVANGVITVGAVLAVARITGCCRATVGRPHHVCGCGRWAAGGQFHWAVTDVQVLDQPVPCRGYQKLWTPDPGALDAVRRQVTP